MKRILLLITTATIFLSSCSQSHNLVKDGQSDYKIFVSDKAIAPEKYAAEELQAYLYKISGFEMEITHEAKPDEKLIYIGFNGAPLSIIDDLNVADFENEEYIVRSDGKSLLIAGGGTRGTLYGIIGYLADYLDCRWYTREVVKIPKRAIISIANIEDRQKPAFEYREAWYREAYDTEWAVHNRLNPSIVPIPDSLGGSYITYPFAHTFYRLVSPEKYFRSHPEYFSEINGKRVGKDAQLCLTNPEVVKVAISTVFDWIKEHPEANVFSIDQNDGEGYCECKNCKALDEKEGSHSGTLISFVNQIADTVAKAHPEIKLQTFAYVYTEIPPRTIRPAKNVMIRLCHYNYCSAHPLGGCDSHKPYLKRLDQWKSISNEITIWDYYTDFAQYLMPFPNFETIKNDVKFYADRGIKGLFAQGNNVPDNGGGEFTELRAWIFAQLLWNPNQDAQHLIDEFVANVYGDASEYIAAYIRLLHEQITPDTHFSIWSEPIAVNYLNLPTIQKADSLFALAKQAALQDTSLSNRVELAYLPILYTKLFFYSIGGTAYLSTEDMPEALSRFKAIIDRHHIKSIGDIPETYGNLGKFLEKVETAGTFYTDWWVIGPFDSSDQKGLKTVYPPELEFDASMSYTGMQGNKIAWKKYADKTSGYIDFSRQFMPSENVVAYAQRTLDLPAAKMMKFGVGSNDGVRVWINGKLMLDRPVSRRAIPNEDSITVQLNQGSNTILVKVDQLKRGWGFYFSEESKAVRTLGE